MVRTMKPLPIADRERTKDYFGAIVRHLHLRTQKGYSDRFVNQQRVAQAFCADVGKHVRKMRKMEGSASSPLSPRTPAHPLPQRVAIPKTSASPNSPPRVRRSRWRRRTSSASSARLAG